MAIVAPSFAYVKHVLFALLSALIFNNPCWHIVSFHMYLASLCPVSRGRLLDALDDG
jgi:hypothetical protein